MPRKLHPDDPSQAFVCPMCRKLGDHDCPGGTHVRAMPEGLMPRVCGPMFRLADANAHPVGITQEEAERVFAERKAALAAFRIKHRRKR